MISVFYYKPSAIQLARRHTRTCSVEVDAITPIESYQVVGDVVTAVYHTGPTENGPWEAKTLTFNPETDMYYDFVTVIEEGKPETILSGHKKNTIKPRYSAEYRRITEQMSKDLLANDDFMEMVSFLKQSSHSLYLEFCGALETHARMYFRYKRRLMAQNKRERDIVNLHNDGKYEDAQEAYKVLEHYLDYDVKKVAAMFNQDGVLKAKVSIREMVSMYRDGNPYPNSVGREETLNRLIWRLNDIDRLRLYELNPFIQVDMALNAQSYGEQSCLACNLKSWINKHWKKVILNVNESIFKQGFDALMASEAEPAIHDSWARNNFYRIWTDIMQPVADEVDARKVKVDALTSGNNIAKLAAKHNMELK